MTLYKFITRSLWYFRKQHLAVFAGTLISTAVLTGALIIGDSVNFSLKKLVETRLGNVRYALVTGNRFVRSGLAYDLASNLKVPATPVLLLRGIAVNPGTKDRINNIQVIGIDSSFRKVAGNALFTLHADEAIISENIAHKLRLKKDDEFLLRVENATIIPLNAPFASETKSSEGLRLKVKTIANDQNMGRFTLRNNQSAPFNVFVSKEYLSIRLNLVNRTNVILFAGNVQRSLVKDSLDKALEKEWRLEDAGLKIQEIKETGQYEIVSDRIFIDPPITKEILRLKQPSDKMLTYLVNSIRFKQKQTPYSFATAASSDRLPELKKDEITVTEWLAQDLGISPGDSITLRYYVIGPLRTLSERSKQFIVARIIPTHDAFTNQSLMPAFPGMADAGSCRDWNTSVPIDLKQIRDKDEKFWNDFKGTPKAFISIQAGQEIWSNQFGNLTAIRFNKNDISLETLKTDLSEKIKPRDIGISILPVYEDGLRSANNGVDFGELFLSLSFFIIAAGILLTVLIYTLNTETRSRETAVLAGLGFTRKRIVQIRFAESAIVIMLGGIMGALSGILYNYGLLAGLNSVWQDAVRTNTLEVDIQPATLAIGAISGMIIALLSIYMVTRSKLKQPVANLLKGTTIIKVKKRSLGKVTAYTGIIGAALLAVFSIISSAHENAGLFLSAGGLFLIGSTAFIIHLISKPIGKPDILLRGITHLAIKNAGRNKARSTTVILVLAIGTFSIVLTGAFRKAHDNTNKTNSGSGGYTFWAETTLPLPYNLNTQAGRSNLITDDTKTLDGVSFCQMQSLDGDDASCLNLNQVRHPRILGVPSAAFDKRGAFSFAALSNEVDKTHPWLELNKAYRNHVYPAYADQTVIQYGLKKSIGDTLTFQNETGDSIRFRLMGGLDNSIFQGSLLISDSLFRQQFPSVGGSKIMLVDVPTAKQQTISEILSSNLTDYGIDITSTLDRLAEFDSVENTYLTVFMALGGLGLLIGTFGLGIILFRNMLERRKELALLISFGFQKNLVFKLVLLENLFLLVSGVLCGVFSALIGILPSIISPSFSFHATFLISLIMVILIAGGLWIVFLTKYAMKGRLVEALRDE
jgi:putative ABC transport system permease protein